MLEIREVQKLGAKTDRVVEEMSKRHRRWLEGAPKGQIQDNLSNKKNNDGGNKF